MPVRSRREILALAAGGLSAATAGCFGRGTGSDSTTTSSTTSATDPTPSGASPAPSCRGRYTSFDPGWVVEGPGPLGGFELSLASDSIARGDTLTAELTNVSDDQQPTGNRKKYDVQYRGEDGWHTIFGTRNEHPAWTDEGIGHSSGHGFSWEFTFTRDGLSNAVAQTPTYYVCAPIEAGTYRFVYWGITPPKEEAENFETDYALGVEFTVIEA